MRRPSAAASGAASHPRSPSARDHRAAQAEQRAEDRAPARGSLREDLTRERFYFVMADRFENGAPTNDDGGYGGDRLVSGLDPTAKGSYHGG